MFNTRRPALVALLVVLVAGALGLAACGGGGGEDANKVLKETFSGGKKVKSGKIDLKLRLEAEGSQLGGPVSITLAGPFQSQGTKTLPSFDFDLTLALGRGGSFKAGAVSTGTAGFLKFQNQVYAVPPKVFAQFKQGFERAQAQQSSSGNKQSFATLGVDPSKWLKDPKNEGETDVAGTKTIHISAGVDVPKLLDDVNRILARAGGRSQQLPSQLTPQQRKAVGDAVDDASFDVYTGKEDKILRRMTIELKFKVPEGQRRNAQGISGGTVSFDLTLADLNQPQTVTAPSSPRPFSELTQSLRQVLGGALGASSGGASSGGASGGTNTTPSTTPGATPGAGPGDAKAQQYADCISKAGGDITKAQQCASILSGG